MSEHLMYGKFTTRFVDTKCHEMVEDLLEKASPTKPLDCLMAALLARASLPPKVWTKSTDQVTWNDVFKYLPSVLVSRLQNEKVMEYLEKYPVFLQRPGTSNACRASPSGQEHPPTASNSSNSAHQAPPANEVTDVATNDTDRVDASGAIKGKRAGRGAPKGENRPHLHAEKRTSGQSLAKDEVENSDADKHQARKKRRKNSAKARSRNTDAQSHRSISSTEQVPIRDQLQPGTNKADLPSNLSHLDEEPSSNEGSIIFHNTSGSVSFKCEPVRGEKNLEESSSCVAVESHSVPEAISRECQTSTSDITISSEDHFLDTADEKGTAHKAENASTLDDAVLGEDGESSTQSDNYHTPSMTCEAREFSNVLNTNYNTATEGSTQADDFSNGSHVTSLPEQGLPAQANDSSGCETQPTKNEAIPKHEDQTLKTLQNSLPPEQDPNSLKCETRLSEEPLLGFLDECDFPGNTTNAETSPEDKHTNASAGHSAVKEDRESSTENLQSEEDDTANSTSEDSEALGALVADISISASGNTMRADHLWGTAPVVPPVEEVFPAQGNKSAEHKTYSTKKEPLVGRAHGTLNVPPRSLVPRSAPVTPTVMPQSPALTAFPTPFSARNLIMKFEKTTPMPRFSGPHNAFHAGYTKSAAKEQIFPYTKSQQQLPGGTTPFKNEHDGPKLLFPDPVLESGDEHTSLAPAASHHNTYSSQLGEEQALCIDRFPADSQDEAKSYSESL